MQNSTYGHIHVIKQAIDSIALHPWFGIGIGTQSQVSESAASSGAVLDGAAWAILVEGGALLFVTFVLLILSAFSYVYREMGLDDKHDYLVIGFLIFSLYQFGIAAFINSAYFGKTPFIMYWLVFGLIMAGRRSRMDESARGNAPTPTAIIRPPRWQQSKGRALDRPFQSLPLSNRNW